MMRAVASLVVAVASVAALWMATQYVAGHVPDPAVLGPPWEAWGELRIYPPWGWLAWAHAWGTRAPELFRNASAITTCGALAGAGLGLVVARAGRSSSTSHAYGSSRWATKAELRQSGLLGGDGVVLCQTEEATFRTRVDRAGPKIKATRLGSLVCHNGPEHVICFAPTGSGKGVGLVVPTLLTWKHSAIVYDIKKENWQLTAGWRRKFSHVWRFEPTSPNSVRFNPLLEIRRGEHEVRDVQNVADMLVDPNGEKESRDHWQTTAHTLLCGAILHVLYAEHDKTLAGVAAFLSNPSRTQAETLDRMLRTSHLPSGRHPVVAQVAREMANKSDNELSGVYSTAMACLGLYRDPLIARNTAESDFRIADLVGAQAPVSLYLVVPPSDLTRTRPVMRLVLNQIARRLTESMGSGSKQRLLLLLDEFPTLGRLEFFESALAFVRGYGIKAFLVVQSLNQLEKAYGQHNSILDNCHVRITYAANDDRTARRISDLLGQGTEKRVQKSFSGCGLFLSNRTESEQEYGRPLLTPGEVGQLPADEAVLLVGGMRPYRGKKIRHYLDLRFRDRAGLPAPDRPDEQARELFARRASEWDDRVVGGPPAPRTVANDGAMRLDGRPEGTAHGNASASEDWAALWSDVGADRESAPAVAADETAADRTSDELPL